MGGPLMPLSIAIGVGLGMLDQGDRPALTITLVDAIAAVPFTVAAPEGYVFIAGDVTIRVQAATPTGATTDVPGTITAAGVVDEVTAGAFAAAVEAAGAIAPATVNVQVIGAVAVETLGLAATDTGFEWVRSGSRLNDTETGWEWSPSGDYGVAQSAPGYLWG